MIGRCRTRDGQADARAEAEGAACQGESGERSPKFHYHLSFLGVCVARPPDHANLGVCLDRGERLAGRAKANKVASDSRKAIRPGRAHSHPKPNG